MKTMGGFHCKALLFLVLALLALPALARAAVMNDYCIVPPFIGKNVPSNLLLMVDNSSSMWDIAYSDEGNKDAAGATTREPYYCYDETYKSRVCSNNSLKSCTADTDCGTGKFCSNNPQQSCTADADCTTGNTCVPKSCTANEYAGYFDNSSYYAFDFTNNYFDTTAPFPSSATCTKFVANTLCVRISSSTNKVDYFVASGNYLNWLTASKFDVEKEILTGGKVVDKLCYASGVATDRACKIDGDCASGETCTDVTNFLQAESRGCVGQGFIKTALTADFANFTTTDANTRLGITFSIRGPIDSANPSSPSRGGQTYIEIYEGTYNNQLCQAAINNYYDSSVNQSTLQNSIQACLNYNPAGSNYCSARPALTCTTDANCIVHVSAQPGGCSDDASPCTANADCGSTTTAGTCRNDPPNRACLTDSDCTVGMQYGTCSNDPPNRQCTQDSNCTIAQTLGSCSNQIRSCTQASDCTIATVNGTCGGGSRSGLACTAGTECPIPEVVGHCNVATGTACRSSADCAGQTFYCSNNPNKTCSTLGTACSGSNGTCVAQSCIGYVASSYAACNGYVPGSTGACDNYDPGSTGTCRDYVAGSSGSCDNVVTTNHTCSTPPPQAESDTNYGPCVNPTQSGVVKTKIAFSETIQTCWTYLSRGQSIQPGDYTRLIGGGGGNGGKCDDVYRTWGVCSGDTDRSCSIDEDCSAGGFGTCTHGPSSILSGNPALICGNSYLGQFCSWNATNNTCTWNIPNPATPVITAYEDFCNAHQPTVIDTTDTASTSTNFEQLPSLLGGIGVEAQLGRSIGTLPVRGKVSTTPEGLVQEFGDRIRIGAMTFNFNGSQTEASSTAGAVIALPRVCSNDHTKMCILDADCPGSTCLSAASSDQYNFDGGQISYGSYVGEGKCATKTATTCDAPCAGGNPCYEGYCWTLHATRCATDSICDSIASGDRCISNGVGDHGTGLVNIIDNIKGNAWTPFGEAFYNAIGYFARTASGASRTDLRINSGDFDATLNPSQYRCQQNYVLLISDGSSTADRHSSSDGLARLYSTAAGKPAGWDSTCSYYMGSKDLPILTWLAKNRNIASFSTSSASTAPPAQGRDSITTYLVHTGGSNGLTGECNSATLLSEAASNGGTTLKQANKPQDLAKELRSVFEELAAKSASGTAASILSNSEGSGANILQAIFFPKKIFDSQTEASWLGELNNLWYYVDPFIGNSSMREDSVGDFELRLTSDRVVQFWFDEVSGETKVNLLQDDDGDGDGDTPVAGSQGISPDLVKTLWRAGKQLWQRDISAAASPRTIYTPCISGATSHPSGACAGDMQGLMKFSWDSPDNSSALQPYLQFPASNAAAVNLMKYVHGFDYPGNAAWRSRTVKIGNIPAASVSTDSSDPYVTNPRDKGVGVWKLGDVVSSTPRTQSSVRQNGYSLAKPAGYGDKSYGNDAARTGYIYTDTYRGRGMVYVGANDGMLHAFKLGTLNVNPSGDRKASLTGTGLGREEWAFIPRNVLPYLTYYADPNYSHLYFVDGNTALVDASIGKTDPVSGAALTDRCATANYWECKKVDSDGISYTDGKNWRSILVGGMGIGGASRNSDDGCTEGVAGTCVKTPIDGVGYSSYYALDVTNPANPKFLWEFSDAVIDDADKRGLGFATSGAAIMKISARTTGGDGVSRPDNTKNGRWFAVFGSGPTGPIDRTSHKFMGTAQNKATQTTQTLKVYVVDLYATPPFELNQDYWVISEVSDGGTLTTLENAFAGSLVNAPIDTDRWNSSASGNYQDDTLYFGYTRKDSDTGTWTKGGVLRLVTKEDPNPANWKLSKVFDGTGPVTTGIARLQDRRNKHLWLYFGSGRYFYFQDDFNTGRKIYGIKEPCYRIDNTLDSACVAKHTDGQETDQAAADGTVNAVGWSIPLDGPTNEPNNELGGERTITDPVGMTNGAVFFTTYKPNKDFCQFGGNSYMWAVRYDTGTEAPAEALNGKALVQVSTGEFREIDLSTAFTQNHGRKGSAMTGKPPEDPPPIVSSSDNKPVKRIIHIQER